MLIIAGYNSVVLKLWYAGVAQRPENFLIVVQTVESLMLLLIEVQLLRHVDYFASSITFLAFAMNL